MKTPHEDDVEGGKFYITDGENGAKRCKKVFDIFVQFTQYLKEIKVTTQETIDLIKSFRKTNIKVPKTEKVTLNIEEIHALYDFKFDLEKHNIARDVFVFICLTGLRREDYKHFSKFHIKNTSSGIKVYDKLARKTKGSSGVNYKIPLCDISVEILEKYDYKPPLPIKINRDIKDALEITGMFDDPTIIIDKKTTGEMRGADLVAKFNAFISNIESYRASEGYLPKVIDIRIGYDHSNEIELIASVSFGVETVNPFYTFPNFNVSYQDAATIYLTNSVSNAVRQLNQGYIQVTGNSTSQSPNGIFLSSVVQYDTFIETDINGNFFFWSTSPNYPHTLFQDEHDRLYAKILSYCNEPSNSIPTNKLWSVNVSPTWLPSIPTEYAHYISIIKIADVNVM
jgi:hypothetical protein